MKRRKERPWSKRTYTEFASDYDTGHRAYVDATHHMTLAVEKILQKTVSYSELKKELTSFIEKRKDFIDFADSYNPFDPQP